MDSGDKGIAGVLCGPHSGREITSEALPQEVKGETSMWELWYPVLTYASTHVHMGTSTHIYRTCTTHTYTHKLFHWKRSKIRFYYSLFICLFPRVPSCFVLVTFTEPKINTVLRYVNQVSIVVLFFPFFWKWISRKWLFCCQGDVSLVDEAVCILGEFGLFSVTEELDAFFQARHFMLLLVLQPSLLVSVGFVVVTPPLWLMVVWALGSCPHIVDFRSSKVITCLMPRGPSPWSPLQGLVSGVC